MLTCDAASPLSTVVEKHLFSVSSVSIAASCVCDVYQSAFGCCGGGVGVGVGGWEWEWGGPPGFGWKLNKNKAELLHFNLMICS